MLHSHVGVRGSCKHSMLSPGFASTSTAMPYEACHWLVLQVSFADMLTCWFMFVSVQLFHRSSQHTSCNVTYVWCWANQNTFCLQCICSKMKIFNASNIALLWEHQWQPATSVAYDASLSCNTTYDAQLVINTDNATNTDHATHNQYLAHGHFAKANQNIVRSNCQHQLEFYHSAMHTKQNLARQSSKHTLAKAQWHLHVQFESWPAPTFWSTTDTIWLPQLKQFNHRPMQHTSTISSTCLCVNRARHTDKVKLWLASASINWDNEFVHLLWMCCA